MAIAETGFVLIVDDDEVSSAILEQIVLAMGFEAVIAESVLSAANIMSGRMPDVIVTDLSMPEVDGYDFLRILKNNVHTADIPVIVASGSDDEEAKQNVFDLGAVEFLEKPYKAAYTKAILRAHMKIKKMQDELKEYNRKLNAMVDEQRGRIEAEQKNMLLAVANVIELKSETDGTNHLDNVAFNSQIIAQGLSLTQKYEDYISNDYFDTIEVAARLHDIGKLGMPGMDNFYNDAHDGHGERGAEILEGIFEKYSENRFLNMAILISRYHMVDFEDAKEDKYGGDGLPLSARIVRVAADYDAFKSGKTGIDFESEQDIVKYMCGLAGSAYDPDVINVFTKLIKQLK